jgi:hypothetical protein
MTKNSSKTQGDGSEVERLNAQERDLALLYRTKAAELAIVRAARGDEVLDALDPAGAARGSGRRVRDLLEELEALADGSGRARQRRTSAIPAVFAAEADEKLREAVKLETEATDLEAESGRLRAALQAHDGCIYVPAPPAAPERAIGGQVGGAPTIVVVSVPRHERLRREAATLRTEAGQLRFREAHTAGSVEADNLEDLLAAVFAACTCAICRSRAGMRVSPQVDTIVAWSERAIEKERARRARIAEGADTVPPSTPFRLHLEWRGGAVDAAGSRIVLPEAAEASTYFDSSAGFEVGDRSTRPAETFDSAAELAHVGGPLSAEEEEVAAGG